MSDSETLRALRELDASTDWEQPGDVLAANDAGSSQDGDAGVAVLPPDSCGTHGDCEGLAAGEAVDGILSFVSDLNEQDVIDHLLVIVNLKNEDQHMLTTIDRNDLIMGCLETAKLNWRDTQIALQNQGQEQEGGEE
jgi:hypothetical protein